MNTRCVVRRPQDPVLAQMHELAPHRARTVFARNALELQIVQGRVWLTLGGAGIQGDRFLAAGDSLHLPAGARAVFEAYPAHPPVRWVCSAVVPAPAAPGPFQRVRFWAAVLGVGWRAATAAASASLAQGSISPGDSSASGGGVR
jgi:hypothetical protein